LKKRSAVTAVNKLLWFKETDTNKDKYLSKAEMHAHEQMITHFTKTKDEASGKLELLATMSQTDI
jgi:hypothetical protein